MSPRSWLGILFLAILSACQRDEFEASRIAHAGGGIDGQSYTNSYEALDSNLEKGFTFFEIDFSFTSDGRLACIHDWKGSFTRSFGLEAEVRPDLETFESLVRNRSQYRKCTLTGLADWLDRNPSAVLITDVKENNLEALAVISEEVRGFSARVVPQIYLPEEYKAVKDLGYRSIIWSLYRFHGTDLEVLNYVKDFEGPFAVTMSKGRAESSLPKELSKRGIPTYVHTVNDRAEAIMYMEKYGATEIYTDFLPPE